MIHKAENPPKHGGLILVWIVDLFSAEGWAVGAYDHEEQEYFISNAYDDEYAVKYWMELPEKPDNPYE